MKDKMLGWLGLNDAADQEQNQQIDPNRAAAALMVEIMAADHHWAEEEDAQIKALLTQQLGITEKDAEVLVTQARTDHAESNDLYRYTSVINQHYDPGQKQALLERLWKIAYVDGQIDRYEEHMLRKLAELLHLSHSKYIQAKLSARDKMQG